MDKEKWSLHKEIEYQDYIKDKYKDNINFDVDNLMRLINHFEEGFTDFNKKNIRNYIHILYCTLLFKEESKNAPSS